MSKFCSDAAPDLRGVGHEGRGDPHLALTLTMMVGVMVVVVMVVIVMVVPR